MKEAKLIHPTWPANSFYATANVMEEAGELFKEANTIREMQNPKKRICPCGLLYGDQYRTHSDCDACTCLYDCGRYHLKDVYLKRMKKEAFHVLVTVVRFLRNFERY